MERKNSSSDENYRSDETFGRGMDDVRDMDEERARNRGVHEESISQREEDLQKEGNLGNERNRNRPDDAGSRR
jgi:hypothetical protein